MKKKTNVLAAVISAVLFAAPAIGGADLIGSSAPRIQLEVMGSYKSGIFDESAAEIAAFDRRTARLFVTNANSNTVDVLDMRTPSAPAKLFTIDMTPFGAGVNSVALSNGLVAVAVEAAQRAGVGHFILLSAICVQKPVLAFQHAKLAFEQALVASGMRYSIVRPTAFFKSLSGQIERVRRGRAFLLFGDGTLTACKPISDRDLAAYIAGCLTDESRWNRILPIGGPGPAITPREQGEALFALLARPPKFRSVPPALLRAIARVLGLAGRIIPAFAAKAELARIGHYYATESMLVLDPETGRCDAAATPSTGTDTLFDHYRAVLAGDVRVERGDHAVF